MTLDQLLLSLLGLAVGGLWVGGLVGLRAPIAPSGYWPIGWALLLAGGALSSSGVDSRAAGIAAPMLGAAFAPAMFAGARLHGGRELPRWLGPASAAWVTLRGVLAAAGEADVGAALALVVEPPFLIAAAATVGAATRGWSRIPLQVALVGLAIAEAIDAVAGVAGLPEISRRIGWVAAAVPTVTLQILSTLERLRTSLVRTSAEAVERAEYLQALVSSIDPARVVLFDREARVQSFFGGGGEHLDVDSLVYSPVSGRGLRTPEDERRLRDGIADVYDGGSARVVPLELGAMATPRTVEIGLSPLRDREGRTRGVLGVLNDVSERERVASALRESEQRLRALVHSLADENVVTIDREGYVAELVGHVDRGEQRYGVAPDQVRGARITEILPGELGEIASEAVASVFRSGESREFEQVVELAGGRFVFHVILRPLRAATGQITHALAVCRDVTERVGAEERKERLEARMLQSQKLESLGVLAGGIAHDFNNLLTGILGNADLALAHVASDDPVRARLLDIERSSVRAAELTAQLLAYAGKEKVEPTTVELGALVEETLPLLHTSVGPATRVIAHRPARAAWMRGDATRVRQLLMNLVTNAVEALDPAGGRVEIETGVVHADREMLARASHADDLREGDYAFLRVRDDGVGMDESTLQRIFDPFFTTKFEGRGLGLASALGIVRAHGGALTVESALGRGTEFRVLFPATAAPERSGAVELERAPLAAAVAAAILVVDDEPAVLAVARRMIEQLGHRAIACSDAESALAAAAKNPGLSAAVIDLTMPDTSGEKLCLQLREIAPELPVLFISGRGAQSALESVGGIERSHFLAKPFRAAALRDALSQLLD